jgi:hypothetical protein
VAQKYELFCNEGPLVGDRIALPPRASLALGRSKRGVHLPDPLVSTEHAEIAWSRDRFVIKDLESQTGTFIDDVRLGRDAVALAPGMRIRIGESTFEVQLRNEWPPWAIPAIGLAVFLSVVVVGVGYVVFRPVTYAPALTAETPVRQGLGPPSKVVPIPVAFVRTEGLDERGMAIRKVSDYDKNAVDELWLTVPGGQLLVTFEPPAAGSSDANSWKILARLPADCVEHASLAFPELRCGASTWVFEDGSYHETEGEGAIVWIRPLPESPGKGKPRPLKATPGAAPIPYRYTFTDTDALAGFLSLRGIEEPIHYLICEEAFPGIRAQVLLDSGEVRPLDYGCIRDVKIQGEDRFEDLGEEGPVIIAFTSEGRDALLDDLVNWMGGSPDGLFLGADDRKARDVLASDPLPRSMMRLDFEGTDWPTNPISRRPLGGVHPLESTGLVANRPAVPAVTTLITGDTEIDPPGCSLLKVSVDSWQCVATRLCLPNQAFLHVREVGCGKDVEIVSAPYGGVVSGGDAAVDVRVAVDVAAASLRMDVLRARVAYRAASTSPP